MEKEPRKEKLADLLKDDETRQKILILIELKQRERFLNTERIKVADEARKIEREIETKHQLNMPESIILTALAQDAEYKHLFEKYSQDYK